jgi:hypothetical protein
VCPPRRTRKPCMRVRRAGASWSRVFGIVPTVESESK